MIVKEPKSFSGPAAWSPIRMGGLFHFHLYVFLNQCQLWFKVKNAIRSNFGITINFSGHLGYHTVYYIVTSPGHPVDILALKTANASKKIPKNWP